jgi:hypothetical protein
MPSGSRLAKKEIWFRSGGRRVYCEPDPPCTIFSFSF